MNRDEKYSDEETAQRLQKLWQGVFSASPTPLKESLPVSAKSAPCVKINRSVSGASAKTARPET
jgi:hypothetical protein